MNPGSDDEEESDIGTTPDRMNESTATSANGKLKKILIATKNP
jgi:hypothetical protein